MIDGDYLRRFTEELEANREAMSPYDAAASHGDPAATMETATPDVHVAPQGAAGSSGSDRLAAERMEQVLASMIQGMASFGPDSAFDGLSAPNREDTRPFDFFA